MIRPGRRILIGSGAAEPVALVKAMVERGEHLADNKVVHLMTLGPAPYVEPEHQPGGGPPGSNDSRRVQQRLSSSAHHPLLDSANDGTEACGRVTVCSTFTSSRRASPACLLNSDEVASDTQLQCPAHEPRAPPACVVVASSTSHKHIAPVVISIGNVINKKAKPTVSSIACVTCNPIDRAIGFQVNR